MQEKRPTHRPMADFPVYPEVDEGGGIVQEYAPFVFGGVMLIAAFAFAGNYMGQNANAHNAPPDEQALNIVSPVTNIIAKGSLLPDGENFDIVNLNVLSKQTVVSLGKGDFVNASDEVFISPASVDLSGKADVSVPRLSAWRLPRRRPNRKIIQAEAQRKTGGRGPAPHASG